LDIKTAAVIFVDSLPRRKKCPKSVPQGEIITPKPKVIAPNLIEFLWNIFIIPLKEK
jgi:hypothetical protein